MFRVFFKNYIIIILLLSCLSIISSCGVFRGLGSYNLPPDYADTFKEVNGRDFINHSNITTNLLVELTPLRYEYSPYDTIRMRVSILNVSETDTMYIIRPLMSMANYPNQGIIVKDTAGKKMRVLDYIQNVDYAITTDKYHRKIKGTIAPEGYKLPPGQCVKNIIPFVCGKLNFYTAGVLNRENEPGYYTAYYTQPHEEYDRIKGPIKTRLYSNKVHFKITDYTEEQIKIKAKVDEIIDAVDSKSRFQKIQDLFSEFKKEFPGNLYIPQLQKIINSSSKITGPRFRDD